MNRANQIKAWQKEVMSFECEKKMTKGELTITPERVYLTCQGPWKTNGKDMLSAPAKDFSVLDMPASSSASASTMTYTAIMEQIANIGTQMKDMTNLKKRLTEQSREVPISLYLDPTCIFAAASASLDCCARRRIPCLYPILSLGHRNSCCLRGDC